MEPFNVDHNGNSNVIVAAEVAGVKHFVLVTSIGTDDILNPLNLFWGVSEGCGGEVLAVMWRCGGWWNVVWWGGGLVAIVADDTADPPGPEAPSMWMTTDT